MVMRTLSLRSLIASAGALALTGGALAMPPLPKNFVGAPLSGANHSPPVETCGEGVCVIKLRDEELSYKLNIEDLEDVVMATLHFGQPGENGPVLVTLFELPPDDDDDMDDDSDDDSNSVRSGDDDDVDSFDDGMTLAAGTFTDDDVMDPDGVVFEDGSDFEGTVDGLLRLLREKSVYVNVSTVDNPTGELRAQMRIAGPGGGGPNPNTGNGELCDESECDDHSDDDSDDDSNDDSAAPALLGDLNNDGVVNEDDLRILVANFTSNRSGADDDSDEVDSDDDRPRRGRRRSMIPFGG